MTEALYKLCVAKAVRQRWAASVAWLRHVLQFGHMKTVYWLSILALVFIYVLRVHAQDEVSDLLGRVNGLRASLGLPAYTLNSTLSAAAQSQAQWMLETGTISHSRPDGSTPRSRAQAAGYASTFVSENIYGGTNASVNTAWNFWINSSIHYAGLTNPNYREIGIGVAHGAWGATYVLVFGNPGGPPPLPPQAARSEGAAPQQPSYVVGLDANGNIMHEVQPGDTLGDIALIYGYTWDDIPYMMQLNGLTNPRDLDIGSILLVPPYGGTFTPTPGEPPPTPTPVPSLDSTPTNNASPATDLGIIMPTAVASLTLPPATLASPLPTPYASLTPEATAAVPTSGAGEAVLTTTSGTITRSGPSPWLTAALVVQAGVLIIAGLEFVLRVRRRK